MRYKHTNDCKSSFLKFYQPVSASNVLGSQQLFHTQKTTLLNVINATFSPSPAISRKYPLTKHLFPTAFPPDDPLYYVSAGLVASTPYTP